MITTFTQERLWKLLLKLREKIKSAKETVSSVTILCRDQDFLLEFNTAPRFTANQNVILITHEKHPPWLEKLAVFHLDEDFEITLVHNRLMEQSEAEFLLLYLPFCFWAQKAQLDKKIKCSTSLCPVARRPYRYTRRQFQMDQ